MKKLLLPEWANVAEIFTSIVIVVSLAYVGRELSQNTTAIQQAAYQSTMEMLSEGDLLLATDSELDAIVSTAEIDPGELSEAEWSRFSRYAITRLAVWEYLFLAKQDNSINDSHFAAFENYYRFTICRAGYRKFYSENTLLFSTAFSEYVEQIITAECT